jgi:hypothetical protein
VGVLLSIPNSTHFLHTGYTSAGVVLKLNQIQPPPCQCLGITTANQAPTHKEAMMKTIKKEEVKKERKRDGTTRERTIETKETKREDILFFNLSFI